MAGKAHIHYTGAVYHVMVRGSGEEDRRPVPSRPLQIPIDGEAKDVVEIVMTYGKWLGQCDIPKLFIDADPGSILVGKARDFCGTWKNQKEVTVEGSHFVQEDSPREIGRAVARFICKINDGEMS